MTQLHIQKSGRGKPLALLHGWGLNSSVWDSLAADLETDFTVLNIDLPGFGKSKPTPQAFNLDSLVELIAPHLEQPTTLIGWSMGGLVAQQLALSYPEKVSELVLVATTPYFVSDDNWHGIKPEVLSMFNSQLSNDAKQTIDRFLAIQAMGSETAKDDIKRIRQSLQDQPSPCEKALLEGLNLLQHADIRETIQHTQQPSLRIFGKLDSLVPAKNIPYIEQLSPHSEIVVLEKASHAPFISHKEEFLSHLRAFLAKHGG